MWSYKFKKKNKKDNGPIESVSPWRSSEKSSLGRSMLTKKFITSETICIYDNINL